MSLGARITAVGVGSFDQNTEESFMIGYVTLGTNDFERAAAFYDALLGIIGAGRMMETEQFIAWGVSPTAPALSVTKPHDGNPATVGNGVMIALVVDSTDKVDALHAKAMELGGADEGAPGPRGDSGFYAGYFRDLDGNKLNAFCMSS
jgi:catechol 2,3-dioxygenase-like lactoylglutathione lyase family enzyme